MTFKVVLLSLTFKDVSSQLRRSEPSSFSIQRSEPCFRFGVQSQISSLTFKAASLIWHSEPSPSSVWRLEPSYLLGYDVQSRPFQFDIHRCQFLGLAFRAFILLSLASRAMFSVCRSELHLQFGVQSHHFFSVMTFKVVLLSLMSKDVSSQLRRSEPSSFSIRRSEPCFRFGVQSRISSLAFRATIFFQFDVQSYHLHHISHSLAFRATFLVWHSEPLFIPSSTFKVIMSFFLLEFRAIIYSSLGIQSHLSQFRRVVRFSFGVQSRCAIKHLESPYFLLLVFKVIFPQPCHPQSWLLAFIFTSIAHLAFTILHSSSFSSPRFLVFIAYSSCSSRLPFPLHMTQSFELMAHISVMLLGPLHLTFSCSSHRAVPFGRILSYTPRWFDRYSYLTLIFESLLETSQRKSRFIVQLQRHFESYPSLRILDHFCSFIGLSEFVFYLCHIRGLSFSLVESTSFHSLFTLFFFHSSVHISYTRELYRRGAYFQTFFFFKLKFFFSLFIFYHPGGVGEHFI